MTQLKNRFEKVFLKLEDELLHLRVYSRGTPLHDELPLPSEMRDTLNGGDGEKIVALTTRLQKITESMENNPNPLYRTGTHFLWHHLCNIADWLMCSQRIYAPSANLVKLLTHTALPDFPPGEINFVAPAFVVQLPEPVQVPGSDKWHDFVFCFKDPESAHLVVASYPKYYDTYVPFTLAERQRFAKTSPTARLKALMQMGTHQNKATPEERTVFSYSLNPPADLTYRQAIENCKPEDIPDLTFLYQITLGLNLYLQSNRKKDFEQIVNPEREKGIRGPGIASKVNLFELETSREFPSRPSEGEEGSGRSLPYHFRNAYWRRPKGYGQDPTAEKTEWVTWTWVRADLKDECPHAGKVRPVE